MTENEENLIIALKNIIWLCEASPSTESIKNIAVDALKSVKND